MKKIVAFGGAILAIIIFVMFNITVLSMHIEDNGYAMPKIGIDKILTDSNNMQAEGVKLTTVKEEDPIYERSGNYFTENKVELDLTYPMIIRNGGAAKFILGGSYLISEDFVYSGINNGSIIAGQTHFNKNGVAVDDDKHILTMLKNGVHIAHTDFKLDAKLEGFTIKKNSIVYFGDTFVNVYQYTEGGYEFQPIRGITAADVTYNGSTLPYVEFYELVYNIGERIRKEQERQEEVEEIIPGIVGEFEGNSGDNDSAKDKGSNRPISPKPPEDNGSAQLDTSSGTGSGYTKPNVTVTAGADLIPWVYNINGEILIEDRSGRIQGGVHFNVYDETGRLVFSQVVTSSGLLQIGPLEPNKTYVVEGYYQYLNENGELAFEQCLELTPMMTLPFEGNIDKINISQAPKSVTDSKALILESILLSNPDGYDELDTSLENTYKDILQYISVMTFYLEDPSGEVITTRLNTNQLAVLKDGDELSDYKTASILTPNTNYKYTIVAGDRYGNEFTFVTNYTGTYMTCKTEPRSTINTATTGIGLLELEATHQDEFMASTNTTYTIVLYYMGEELKVDYEVDGVAKNGSHIELPIQEKSSKITIKNLPYSIPLEVKAFGEYDLGDGQGTQKNQMIGSTSFYSSGVPTGTININNTFTDIAGTTATMDIVLMENSTTSLSQLLTKIDIIFTGEDGKDLEYRISKSDFDKIDIEAKYNDRLGAVVIQEANRLQGTPAIRVYATKDTLLKYGAWGTILNTALYGDNPEHTGTLEVELAQGFLASDNEYQFNAIAGVENLGDTYDVTTTVVNKVFYTLKQEPVITYQDYFISGNFMEIYDIFVEDAEGAIAGNNFILQLWEDGTLIDSSILKKNENISVYRTDMLRAGYEYEIKFVAAEYNLTADKAQERLQYEMHKYSFDHEEGLRAAIVLEGLRYAYGGIDTSGDYGYLSNNYTIGKAFDRTSNKVVDKEGYFITDYLTYKANGQYYSVIRDFVATNEPLIMSFYDSNKNLIGSSVSTGTPLHSHMRAINEYTYPEQFYYTNAAYIRINGTVDKIEAAYYYQYQDKDKEVIFDISDEDKILFGKQPISTSSIDNDVSDNSSTVYLPCTPGETINFRASNSYMYIYFYDDQGVYQSNSGISNSIVGSFLVPTGATQFRLYFANSIMDDDSGTFEISRVKGSDVMSLEATIKWTLEDTSDDIFYLLNENNSQGTYSVTKYVNQITSKPSFDKPEYERKQVINENAQGNIDIEVTTREGLDALKLYQYDLSVQYNGRDILLDSLYFDTEDLIYLVRESGDLDMLHFDGYGQYLVVNDIVEKELDSVLGRILGGTLDFQGHSFTMNYQGSMSGNSAGMFRELQRSGVIKNGEIIVQESVEPRYLVTNNYGTIENMKFTYNSTVANPITKPIVETNNVSGIIDTFLIEFRGPTMVDANGSAVLVETNNGTIRNGYAYNTDDDEGIFIKESGGIFTYTSSQSSIMENIYIDLDLYWNYPDKPNGTDWYTGIISAIGSGRFSNMFGVSTRYNFEYDSSTKTAEKLGVNSMGGSLFGSSSTADSFSNAYDNIHLYSKNNTSGSLYSKDFDLALLYDVDWVNGVLDSGSTFKVSESIMQGFYPMLDMDANIFYSQPFRPLPETKSVTQPEILSIKPMNETPQYVDIEVIFNNPSKLLITNFNVINLSTMIINQTTRDDLYVVTLRVSEPQVFVDSYLMTQFTYKDGNDDVPVSYSTYISAKFYKEISSIEDLKYLEENPTSNARLMNDIDFSNYSGSWLDVQVAGEFQGTFDGTKFNLVGEAVGNYKLKNVTLNNGEFTGLGLFFANVVGGTISNIDFENIYWDNSTGGYASIIHLASQASIENVYGLNITLTGSRYVATLINTATGTDITNCGINGAVLRPTADTTSFGAAGMVGLMRYSNISNSFVIGLNAIYNPVNATSSSGIGGIVGLTSGAQSRVENSYATGYIENPRLNGGIVGNGVPYIDQCYSDVKILAFSDYNGGISGGSSTSNNYISNSFAIGDIVVTAKSYSNSHRVSALKNMSLNVNNFAYKGQMFNSENIGNDDANALLSYDSLTTGMGYVDTIKLGNEFDYSDKEKGITPKVIGTSGDVLPNQTDNYLLDDNVGVLVKSTEVNGHNTYTVVVELTHGSYKLANIDVEHMFMQEAPKVISTQGSDTTNYELKLGKEQSLDNYRMTVTLSDPYGREVEIIGSINFGEPLYWEIDNIEEWQELMPIYGMSNQNFLITGEIDFSGVTNPILNLEVARFDGVSTDESIITGLRITELGTALVSNASISMGNLTFKDNRIDIVGDTLGVSHIAFINSIAEFGENFVIEDCHITSNFTRSSYVGVVGETVDMSNITVSNSTIDIDYPTGAFNAYTGFVVGMATGHLEDIEVSNSTIRANNIGHVGAVSGYVTRTGSVANIHGSDLTVKAGYSAGGLFGYLDCSENDNLTIRDSIVKDENTIAFNASFSGYMIGGMVGRFSFNYDGANVEGYSVENVSVTGMNRVGGIVGYGGAQDASVKDITVVAYNDYAGGIVGYIDNGGTTASNVNLRAVNVDVYAQERYAGGITGRTRNLENVHVFDSKITSGQGAGGLVGIVQTSFTANISTASVNNTTVETFEYSQDSAKTYLTGKYAGGLIGYLNGTGGTFQYNYVIDTDVNAQGGYAGGMFGVLTSANILNSYASGGTITSTGGAYIGENKVTDSSGQYVGGIAGLYTQSSSYASNISNIYSAVDVSGEDFVGGIFGNVRTASAGSGRNFFNITAYGNVTSDNDAYAIAHFESGTGTENFTNTKGGVKASEEMLVNGERVSAEQLSNELNNSIFGIASYEELSSYTYITKGIGNGGFANNATARHKFFADGATLGAFDVLVNSKNSLNYELKLQNVMVPTGNYQITIRNSESGTTLVNREAIVISGNTAYYSLPQDILGDNKNIFVEIYSGLTSVGSAYYEGINDGYSYTDIKVNGSNTTYKYSDSNESITLSVDNGIDYQWYRIYEGQGYTTSKKLNITEYSTSSGVTVDIPGVYYAVDETSMVRSQMFVYETNTYYPMIATSAALKVPYQSGYSITDSGVVELNASGLVLNGIVNQMVSRVGRENSITTMMLEEMKPIILEELIYNVYASGIDTINLELDESIAYRNDTNGLKVTIVSGENTKEHSVTGRVMTFAYDFKEDVTFTISLGEDSVSTNYSMEALHSEVSTYKDEFYYQALNGVGKSDGSLLEGDFLNIKENKALDNLGNIYSLEDNSIIGVLDDIFEVRETKALYESTYGEGELLTYKTFTYNATTDVATQLSMFTRGGQFYAIDGQSKRDNIALVADYYLDEKYMAYVNKEGDLIELNTPLHKPEDFNTSGIVEISDTYHSDKSIVLVRYGHGTIVTFNYVTGEVIDLVHDTNDLSLSDYGIMLISNLAEYFGIGDNTTNHEEAYLQAQEYVIQLEETPSREMEIMLESVALSDGLGMIVDGDIIAEGSVDVADEYATKEYFVENYITQNPEYISVYNEADATYETFVVEELVMNQINPAVSVEERVETATENGYEGTLNNMVANTKVISVRNNKMDLAIYMLISIGVAGLLFTLVNKSKRKEK